MRINRSIISNQTESVPVVRTLTINGVTYDLTANRSWTVSGGSGTVTSVGLSSATSGVTIGGTPITTSGTLTIAIATASGSSNGLLSSTDWTTFNNKQNTITNPVTGTGTTNYLSKWTSDTALGNSLVFDNGTNVGINNNDPVYKLDVNGGSSHYLLNLESTWNNSSLVGYGINVNVTNTASDPSSYLLRLAIANNDYFSVKADGRVYMVLPTSSSGLSSGELWNDSGTLKIV